MNDLVLKSIKNILTLGALAVAIFVPVGQVVERYQNIVALLFLCLGWVVTIVVIAALMRKDLQRIDELHGQNVEKMEKISNELEEIKTALDGLATKRGGK